MREPKSIVGNFPKHVLECFSGLARVHEKKERQRKKDTHTPALRFPYQKLWTEAIMKIRNSITTDCLPIGEDSKTGRRKLFCPGDLLVSDKAAAAAAAAAALLFLDMIAAIEKSVALVFTDGTTNMAAAAGGNADVVSCIAPRIIFSFTFKITQLANLKRVH